MKKLNPLTVLMLLAVAALLCGLTGNLLAQSNAAAVATNALPDAGPVASAPDWLVAFAQKHHWLAVLVAVVGGLRIVLKPVFSIWHQISPASEEVAERSTFVKWILYALDWAGSVKLVNPNPPAK